MHAQTLAQAIPDSISLGPSIFRAGMGQEVTHTALEYYESDNSTDTKRHLL